MQEGTIPSVWHQEVLEPNLKLRFKISPLAKECICRDDVIPEIEGDIVLVHPFYTDTEGCHSAWKKVIALNPEKDFFVLAMAGTMGDRRRIGQFSNLTYLRSGDSVSTFYDYVARRIESDSKNPPKI
ncbi:hypothetical protein CMI41_00260 [Candidatus Pacearchaeota archaeon]|nr:hypothetical protein [Candidatus Pacearchaeota archaeon]